MKSKGGMSNTSTGILVGTESDPRYDAEWEALHQRLLHEDEEGNLVIDEGETPYDYACVAHLAPGALIGTVAASIFLAWLDSSPRLGTASSIFSSMFWSFMTAFASYICFHFFTILAKALWGSDEIVMIKQVDETEDANPPEYYFCVGVFMGFCTLCMTHDFLLGFPLLDILMLTGLPAIAFATLMLHCAKRKHHSTPILPKFCPLHDSH